MRIRLLSCLVAVGLLAIPVTAPAQSTVADSSVFRALPLPAANSYRTGAGRPGPDYWQQRVEYSIDATLDAAANELRGTETIRYANNSPSDLTYIWMHLEQNICAPESITNRLDQPPLVFLDAVFDFSCQGFEGGMRLDFVRSGGAELAHTIYGTTMRVDLSRPLASGSELELEVGWSFPIPPYGAARMGSDGPLYEIAWWYPRLAVFDDVRGWNNEPYIGAGEFYLEYGSFDVALTLPAEFIVTATGVLQNPGEVLTAVQRQRLRRAIRSDTTVAIISAAEVGRPQTRPAAGGTLTWRFHADSVRDFAFAAGSELRWDASGWDGILIQTLYRPAAVFWEEANRMSRHTIRYLSENWYRYPYPHATTVEGPIEGMEYPMLTFVPAGTTREELHWVLSHEFGHEWFPMIVGSNERLYPWMDEGFNTFIDIGIAEDYFAGEAYGDTVSQIAVHLYPTHGVPGEEQPLITRPVESRDLFWVGYRKPSLMLQLLREEVMGEARFDFAFREYITAWAFKHPRPADFFRVMRDAGGMDLDWFWRGWIYSTARLDQAIDGVRIEEDGPTTIFLANRGQMVMPVTLRIAFTNGDLETVRLPVEMWNLGSRYDYRVPGSRTVAAAEIDPAAVLPDTDRSNNVWRP